MGFLLPGLLGIAVFFILPLGYCIVFSFSRTFGRFDFIGLENYRALFRSMAFWMAIKNTIIYLLISIFLVLVIALVILYCLEYGWQRWKYIAVCSTAMFVPSTLVVKMVESTVGNEALRPELLYVLIFLWKYLGINLLIIYLADNTISRDVLEAAVIDGAGRWNIYKYIRLCYLLPNLKFLVVFNCIVFFKMFRESYLLYGYYPPDKIYMIQNLFFNHFQSLHYQRLSTSVTIMILLLLGGHYLLFKLGEKYELG